MFGREASSWPFPPCCYCCCWAVASLSVVLQLCSSGAVLGLQPGAAEFIFLSRGTKVGCKILFLIGANIVRDL